MDNQFLKSYFASDYKGIDSIINEILIPIFGAQNFEEGYDLLTRPDSAFTKKAHAHHIQSVAYHGTIYAEGIDLKVYDVTLDSRANIARSRVGIRQVVAEMVEQFDGAFIIFHYVDNTHRSWRLSYIEKIPGQKKSKRFTYLCGENFSCRTIAERLNELQKSSKNAKELETAFSVEALSNEFFSDYKHQYEIFCQYIEDNKHDNTRFGEEFATEEGKYIRDYVKKMMGRLTFLCFLQRRGWLGVPATEKDWNGGDTQFLFNLYQKATPQQQENFLDEVLEPLFFECLNEKRDGDIYDTRVAAMGRVKIPYLNGGLFDRETIDNFRSVFPAKLFQDLFNFFASYNFTIDENDPNDAEVGVDPEMLGKIFENLLEDNKDKGAFYTPKEIVQYMCRESLIAYLIDEVKKKATFSDNFEEAIRAFVSDPELSVQRLTQYYKENQLRNLSDALREVKICDPAIGSGAFPMGLLNLIFRCRLFLNQALGIQQSAAKLKQEIIQNNIYGVDIEKGAIDIARLRFWLAIIVDAEKPEPLPNFDYKFMQGNSLLEQFEGVDLKELLPKEDENDGLRLVFSEEQAQYAILKNMQEQYFLENNHKRKYELREQINSAVKDLIRIRTAGRPDISEALESINVAANTHFFLWHTWFADVFNRPSNCNGFDIVIGNPPYISAPTQVANPILAKQRKRISDSKWYSSLNQKWDLYIPFMELGIRYLCADGGVMTMIVPYPFTNQTYAEKLRKMFTHDYNLSQVVDLNGTKIFDHATVSNCIPFVSKAPQQDIISIAQINEQRQIYTVFKQPLDKLRIDDKSEVWNLTQEQRQTNRHPNMHTLGDFCYISVGMVLNADERTAKGEFSKDELISLTKDIIHCREYIEAKDIEPYRVKRVRYLEYNTHRVPDKLRRPTFRELYDRPKLVMNCLGGLNATLDKREMYLHNHSIYCAVRWIDFNGVNNKSIAGIVKKFSNHSRSEMEKLSQSVDLRYLLGIINARYMKVLLDDIRSGDYHIYPEHVRNLPIPSATPVQQQPIIDLVDTILAKKKADPQADTTTEESTIDKLVYQLYNLTDDEIRLIEQV